MVLNTFTLKTNPAQFKTWFHETDSSKYQSDIDIKMGHGLIYTHSQFL